MEWKRNTLYVAAALLSAALVFSWQKEHPEHHVPSSVTSTTSTQGESNYTLPTDASDHLVDGDQSQNYLPQLPHTLGGSSNQQDKNSTSDRVTAAQNGIHVRTNVLDVTINTQGGNLVSTELLKYPVSIQDPHVPVQLLSTNPQQLYMAQSGLLPSGGVQKDTIVYQSAQKDYRLAAGEKQLQVRLVGKTNSGLQVEKVYTFARDQYAIGMEYRVLNRGTKPWSGAFYQQITRKGFTVKNAMHGHSYIGPSISSHETPYEKIPFKKLDKMNISRDIQGGWLAMQQQYFLTAWIPPQHHTNHFYSHVTPSASGTQDSDNVYTVGYFSPMLVIAPGKTVYYKSVFYTGPELPEHLQALAKNLDRTIDYGWLWFISKFIFWLMEKVHQIVQNWGWSIVIVTLLLRASLYWFAARGYRSMARMRDLQPKIQALRERFAGDQQALSKATMEFYKKEKINPMGGCLPMLVQVPVFFALYYVLVESVELRQAPFILWIQDLSAKDPYYVLPILMGLSMLLQQKLSPPPPDPTQAKMMMLLPVVFTVFFLSFPAGLVLYWLTNNLASIAQQWYIMRTYDPKLEQEKTRKKKKKKAKQLVKI